MDFHESSQLLKLSTIQQQAIELLASGLSDRQVSERVGVCRETITRWRLYHPAFRAEFNRLRRELWDNSIERLRNLIPQAVAALEAEVNDPENPNRGKIALEIVRLARLPNDFPHFSGAETPEGVIRGEAEHKKMWADMPKLVPEADEGDLDRTIRELKSKLGQA